MQSKFPRCPCILIFNPVFNKYWKLVAVHASNRKFSFEGVLVWFSPPQFLMMSSSLDLRFSLLSIPTCTPHCSSCYISQECFFLMMNVHVLACQPDGQQKSLISPSLTLSLSPVPPPAAGVFVEPVSQVIRETFSTDTEQKIYSCEVRAGETKGSIFQLLLCQSSEGQISLAVWFMETEEGTPNWGIGNLMVIVEASWNALENHFWERNLAVFAKKLIFIHTI